MTARKRRTRNEHSAGRTRMSPEEREALIVQEAVRFFAEQGFEGKTRDLAKRVGMTQPLLYRYFPSKESLIERVYHEVYVRRWNPDWDGLISDRREPLERRLCRFYKEYSRAIYDYVWVRIFVYSGLKAMRINERYLRIIRQKVLEPVCVELRHAHGLPDIRAVPLSDAEIELAWGLHGAFFYRAVRHFVYNLPITKAVEAAIENDVRVFLNGAPRVHRKLLGAG